MQSLNEYLASQYLSDQQELTRLEKVIRDTSVTLCQVYSKKGWPYRIVRGAEKDKAEAPPAILSHSTTAMVSLSLLKLLGTWRRPKGYPVCPTFPPPRVDNRSKVSNVALKSAELLSSSIVKTAGTSSGTYGRNDPLTLGFVAGFSGAHERGGKLEDWRKIQKYVRSRCNELKRPGSIRSKLLDHNNFFEKPSGEIVSNALIPLRIVQAVRDSHGGTEQDLSAFREYFETTLHDQLSFSSIPDSRFDPAELTFCLEGLLLAQGYAVDRALFKRVLEVLAKAQLESAFWRPTKPFMATQKGMSLFPVSVEVANSLLRACEMFDGLELHDTFGSSSLELFRRYWQWLGARTVTFTFNKAKMVGWHSEHVNQPNVIHVWETSQVLEFLVGFHRLLQAHIARTTLILSRFDTKPAPFGQTASWSDVQSKSESVTALGEQFKIYDRIGKEFIRGWREDISSKNYSMLLYGPPGTGKTKLASTVAAALSFPLVTITVSDFLELGGAQVEARAKAIFHVLSAQSNCVVFFDEIDNFLLDRDTQRYVKQDTVFQFMTPGMLTKLNDLRRVQRVIFAIGTNYENRIDPAIKRSGRIDKRYLVLPPDAAARKRTFREQLTGHNSAALYPSTTAQWNELAANSVFLGFRDIADAISVSLDRKETFAELSHTLLDIPRTIRLATFRNRLPDGTGSDTGIEEKGKYPIEEFLCLLALALEAGESKFLDETASRGAKLALASELDISESIQAAAAGLNNKSVSRIAKYLNSLKEVS